MYLGGPAGAAAQLAQENPDRPHEAAGGAEGRDAEPPAATLKLPDDKIFLTASLWHFVQRTAEVSFAERSVSNWCPQEAQINS
jgi:hypothetical protein